MSIFLKSAEISEVRTSLGHSLAGEYPGRDVEAAERAHSTLSRVPRGGALIGFSAMEMDMLWVAIENGAEGVLQPSSGMRPDQKAAFRKAANRLKEAAKIERPGF